MDALRQTGREARRERRSDRDRQQAEQRQADEVAVMATIDRLAAAGEAATLTRIRNGAPVPEKRVDRALERLRQARTIRLVRVQVAGGRGALQEADAYERVPE